MQTTIESESPISNAEVTQSDIEYSCLSLAQSTEMTSPIAQPNDCLPPAAVENANEIASGVEEEEVLFVRKASTTEKPTTQDGDKENAQSAVAESRTPIVSPTVSKEEAGVEESEKREAMLQLIHEKLRILLEKQAHINSIQTEIANLDSPAAKDVSVLRDRMDKCMKWGLL